MNANARMKALLDKLGSEPVELPQKLARIASEKLIAQEGCYFAKSLYLRKGRANLAMFPDATGYECFVNHIHVDDYTEPHSVLGQLRMALSLIDQCRGCWLHSQSDQLPIRFIVSCDESSCTFRFHVIRAGQKWEADDLEGYAEAVLVA